MKPACLSAALILASPWVQPADIAAGKAVVARVCAACHGENGVSVADTIPNLGGQRAAYIEMQLRALREGSRRNGIMNTIARQLGPNDIANIAAYYASLPGAGAGSKSDFMPNIAKTGASFPADWKTGFTRYHAINFPELKHVKVYFANATALAAARAGRPLPDGSVIVTEQHSVKLDDRLELAKGADGLFVPNQLLLYSVSERRPGWGRDLPDILRNEDWNYAAFNADRTPRPGVNHAECLACHKAQGETSFLYTLKELAAAR